MKTIKVMIVDDRDIIRDSLKIILKRVPDVEIVGEADNGADASELLKTVGVDVLITDIHMPFKNGTELIEQTRKDFPSIKILAMSIDENDYTVAKLCKFGINGYFVKDENLKNLPVAIRSVFDGWYYLSDKVKYTIFNEEYLVKTYFIPNVKKQSSLMLV